jgi:hypothetical protein
MARTRASWQQLLPGPAPTICRRPRTAAAARTQFPVPRPGATPITDMELHRQGSHARKARSAAWRAVQPLAPGARQSRRVERLRGQAAGRGPPPGGAQKTAVFREPRRQHAHREAQGLASQQRPGMRRSRRSARGGRCRRAGRSGAPHDVPWAVVVEWAEVVHEAREQGPRLAAKEHKGLRAWLAHDSLGRPQRRRALAQTGRSALDAAGRQGARSPMHGFWNQHIKEPAMCRNSHHNQAPVV